MATTDATNPAPWPAGAYPAVITDQITAPVYEVILRLGGADVTVPAWDVSVDLDASRSPYGTAMLKVADTVDVTALHTPIAVKIRAGWNLAGTTSLQTLFVGLITSYDYQTGACALTAESAETYFDAGMSSTGFNDPDDPALTGLTTVKTIIEYPSIGNFFLRRPNLVNVGLNTPTTDQIDQLKQVACWPDPDTNVDDLIHALAAALGQRARADIRDTAGAWPRPWTYQIIGTITANTPLDLSAVTADYSRRGTIDDLANIVQGSTSYLEWNGTEWDQITVDAEVRGASVGGWHGSTIPPPGTTLVRIKQPSGVIRGTSAPGLNTYLAPFLREAVTPTEVATCRAIWWLTPTHWAKLSTASVAREIRTIRFDVSAGLMTLETAP